MRRIPLASLMMGLVPAGLFAEAAKPGKAKGQVHQVKIKSMAFDPPLVLAKAGDSIQWTNEDIFPHTATGGGFDSGLISPGESWSVTLMDAGQVSYKCSYHPTMLAQIKVSKLPK